MAKEPRRVDAATGSPVCPPRRAPGEDFVEHDPARAARPRSPRTTRPRRPAEPEGDPARCPTSTRPRQREGARGSCHPILVDPPQESREDDKGTGRSQHARFTSPGQARDPSGARATPRQAPKPSVRPSRPLGSPGQGRVSSRRPVNVGRSTFLRAGSPPPCFLKRRPPPHPPPESAAATSPPHRRDPTRVRRARPARRRPLLPDSAREFVPT